MVRRGRFIGYRVYCFVEESSKLETQPRQKPKAKFRDSFIFDTKDEGLYSAYEQNGFTEPSSVTLRSIIKTPDEDDQDRQGTKKKPNGVRSRIFLIRGLRVFPSVETVVKSKSQSTVYQSRSVTRSDGSGNVSVTQDFLKGGRSNC